mmetsp:Transcript_5929/g.9948  ORF Transcript_5929/g.9948 Transcript_5929/m.9948 type:complete len:290 (-) Transcript_5929:9-878(-)
MQLIDRLLLLSLIAAPSGVVGFSAPNQSSKASALRSSKSSSSLKQSTTNSAQNESDSDNSVQYLSTRREVFGRSAAAAIAASTLFTNLSISNADIEGVATVPFTTAAPEATSNTGGVTLYKTKSGLQFIDLVEGTGSTPRYGNFVTISYKAYIKLPDIKGTASKLDEFDSDAAYLVKHGNGRNVPGLDEGLHTMKVGGKRRIIIPPKLGYVTSGIGPIPVGPVGRWKLNHLLDKMVEVKGGNLIFDVEMKSIIEDEADQGYYDDDSLSPEDFERLRENIQSAQQASRGA